VSHLLTEFSSAHDTLDVLVNNAGMDIPKSIEDATFDDWTKVLRTKSDDPFLMIKTFLPFLKKSQNANIVNITSHEGDVPNPGYLAYGVGTAALIAMTKGLARSLPKYGIRVNAVSPGAVRTPLWIKTGEESEALWKDFAIKNPMGRVPTVDDVAEAVMLLINDKYKYLNGVFLDVNGGSHLQI
jgi:NAD(P)-dependent dehydrogenase (short-subunit alcohol dehydrogenase family)